MRPPDPGSIEAVLRRAPAFERAAVTGLAPVEGGASNITFRVGLQDGPYGAVALRLQRESGIFQPYDVVREGEVIRALKNTAIPVPDLVLSEPDPAPLGAPYIVLEWIDAPHMAIAGPQADYAAFVRMVADIHAVDWRTAGLDALSGPGDAASATAREIDAVAARIDAFGVRDGLLARSEARLREAIPADGSLGLCQGDINVFNYLFRDRKVVGVVDWEQARIGDRRSDIGQLVALSHLKGAPFAPPAETGFVRAYQAAAGAELRGMEFFRALWAWQLTFIHHAWVKSNGSDPWYTLAAVTELLERSLDEVC